MAILLSHPIPGAPLSDKYGWRDAIPSIGMPESLHNGQDYKAGAGTLIRAAAAGVVTYRGWDDTGGGWMLRIDHGGGYQTLYLHMRENSPLVLQGQRVGEGVGIGYVGSTGKYTTGPHLHFMLERNGTPVNPVPYIKTAPAKTPTPKPSGQEEDEDMATRPIGHYVGGTAATPSKDRKWVIYYPDSGLYVFLGGVDQAYINTQAQAHGTKPFTHITEAHWTDQLRPHLDKLIAG